MQVTEHPPGRAERKGGDSWYFPTPFDRVAISGHPGHTVVPVHAICEAREQALAQVLIPGLARRREELPLRACGGCAGRL